MLPVCRTPDAVYAMPPWLYPGRIDLYIHTIRLVKEKNATSRRLCQGKSSLRPAPHHNCTTKRNFRMSGAGGCVFPPLVCRNSAENFGDIREYMGINGICIGYVVAYLWEEPARDADVSRPLRRLFLLPSDRMHAWGCRPPTASLTCWMSETGTRCAAFQPRLYARQTAINCARGSQTTYVGD
jgi:hypothetical protein